MAGACCAAIGPLLVADGTSGRTWTCQTCGHRWSPVVGVAVEDSIEDPFTGEITVRVRM